MASVLRPLPSALRHLEAPLGCPKELWTDAPAQFSQETALCPFLKGGVPWPAPPPTSALGSGSQLVSGHHGDTGGVLSPVLFWDPLSPRGHGHVPGFSELSWGLKAPLLPSVGHGLGEGSGQV